MFLNKCLDRWDILTLTFVAEWAIWAITTSEIVQDHISEVPYS